MISLGELLSREVRNISIFLWVAPWAYKKSVYLFFRLSHSDFDLKILLQNMSINWMKKIQFYRHISIISGLLNSLIYILKPTNFSILCVKNTKPRFPVIATKDSCLALVLWDTLNQYKCNTNTMKRVMEIHWVAAQRMTHIQSIVIDNMKSKSLPKHHYQTEID